MAMQMDGFEDCRIGLVYQFGRPAIICYDYEKVLDKLQAGGMSLEESEEWWSFNMVGAYVGEGTPCFLHANARLDEEEDEAGNQDMEESHE